MKKEEKLELNQKVWFIEKDYLWKDKPTEGKIVEIIETIGQKQVTIEYLRSKTTLNQPYTRIRTRKTGIFTTLKSGKEALKKAKEANSILTYFFNNLLK